MKKKAFLLVALVFEVVFLLGILIYVGQKMDQHFEVQGFFTALAVFVVFIFWFFRLVILVKKPFSSSSGEK